MTSQAPQLGDRNLEGVGVCPHCGVLLRTESHGGFVAVTVEPPAASPAVWHPTRPDFPPPPGCRRIHVPFRGWLDVDDDVRRAVDRFFNGPMLALAVLVLPLLVVDYYVSRGEHRKDWLTTGVMIAHVTISTAFLAEFVVKVSIAQSRLGYIARNWLDLIIIILPFLRPLQGFRTIRFLKPLQVARVVQVSRLYALRGVGLKAVRTMVPVLLGLRFTQRFRQGAEVAAVGGRPDYAKWPRAALVLELQRLQRRIDELESRAAASAASVANTQAKEPSYDGPDSRNRPDADGPVKPNGSTASTARSGKAELDELCDQTEESQ